MVPRSSWPARDNLLENWASSASLGNASAPVLPGLCPMLIPFREHLSCEAKGKRPWHFILSRAVSTIKMALRKPEAVKYLVKGHQGVRLFLSQQCVSNAPFSICPTTKTLVHTQPVSCLDLCHLLLLDFLSLASQPHFGARQLRMPLLSSTWNGLSVSAAPAFSV